MKKKKKQGPMTSEQSHCWRPVHNSHRGLGQQANGHTIGKSYSGAVIFSFDTLRETPSSLKSDRRQRHTQTHAATFYFGRCQLFHSRAKAGLASMTMGNYPTMPFECIVQLITIDAPLIAPWTQKQQRFNCISIASRAGPCAATNVQLHDKSPTIPQ